MSWTMKQLKFALGHIEDFVDAEWKEISERARTFEVQTGLSDIQSLAGANATTPEAAMVLDRLAPFFESGVLLSQKMGNWEVTDVLWRGSVFHLANDERSRADALMTELSPLQVHRAPAPKILKNLGLEFLSPGAEAQGYFLKPLPDTGFVLFSNLADPWASDHISQAHRLINKFFVY